MEKKDSELYDDEIDLVDILSVIYRRKWIILLIMVISVALVTGWIIQTRKDCTGTLIQLNFSGIEKHRYPDGSLFEMYDIIAPDIIARAGTRLTNSDHKKIFIENPREFIYIDPFIPQEIKAKILNMNKENEPFTYLPTKFYLKFVQAGIGGDFSPDERNALIIGIIDEYKAKFNKYFLEKQLVNVTFIDDSLKEKDYSDVLNLLKGCVDTHINFLESVIEKAGYYRSPKTGMSFVDLLAATNILKNISIVQAESIIQITHLSKKKGDLVNKYKYKIQEMEKERQKKKKEAAVARNLLNDVWQKGGGQYSLGKQSKEATSTSVILDTNFLDKFSDKEAVALLLKSALAAEVKAQNLEVDRKFLQKDLAKLIGEDKTNSKALDAAKSDIEQRLCILVGEIQTIGNNINELNKEYLLNKYSNILQIIQYPEACFTYRIQPMMAALLSLTVSFFGGIFIAFLLEYYKNRRKI